MNDTTKPTLQDYLNEAMTAGCHEFRLVPRFTIEGEIVFYMHAWGKPGKTIDFKLDRNSLETICECGTFN